MTLCGRTRMPTLPLPWIITGKVGERVWSEQGQLVFGRWVWLMDEVGQAK